jgi:excisionase family DNA binding protein
MEVITSGAPVVTGLPLMVSVEETAQFLRIAKSSVYEAVRRNEIPATWVGRRVRIPRSWLEQIASGQSREGMKSPAFDADLTATKGTIGW